MCEILRPEQFGLEKTKRNRDLFLTFQTLYMLGFMEIGGVGDISNVIRIFKQLKRTDICVQDIDNLQQVSDLAKGIGMRRDKFGWDYENFRRRGKYFVIRGFDNFVLNNQGELGWNERIGNCYHLLNLAQKYSGGMMLTTRESADSRIYDQINEVTKKSKALNELLSDFAVIMIVK